MMMMITALMAWNANVNAGASRRPAGSTRRDQDGEREEDGDVEALSQNGIRRKTSRHARLEQLRVLVKEYKFEL